MSDFYETFGVTLADLSSARVFELHREIAREASKRYRRTTRWQENYRNGVNASRAKWARETAKRQDVG